MNQLQHDFKTMVTDLVKPGEKIVAGLNSASVVRLKLMTLLVTTIFGPSERTFGAYELEQGIAVLKAIDQYDEVLKVASDLPEFGNCSLEAMKTELFIVVGNFLDVVKRESIYGKLLDVDKYVAAIKGCYSVMVAIMAVVKPRCDTAEIPPYAYDNDNAHLLITNMTASGANRLHMAIGNVGEIAELFENQSHNHGRANLVEELGDTRFYLEGMWQGAKLQGEQSYEPNVPGEHGVWTAENRFDSHVMWASAKLLSVACEESLSLTPSAFDDDAASIYIKQISSALSDLYDKNGITEDESLYGNLHKLLKSDKARYKEGTYSDDAATNRSDKA
jgi:hypothetical protein